MSATQIAGNYMYSEWGSKHIVSTAGGKIYLSVVKYTPATLEMYRSTDGGQSFTVMDAAHAPVTTLLGSCSIAIDGGSPQLIHMLFHSNTTTVKYVTFNTSSDLWGTPVTIDTITQPSYFNSSISLDSANVPHVVYSAKINIEGTDYTKLKYCNKVGGSWQTPLVVEASLNEAKTATSPMIAIDTTSGGDHRTDIPQISYKTSDNLLQAALGVDGVGYPANNPTSFSVVRPGTKNASGGTAIAIDSNGRTNIGFHYNSVGNYTQVIHIDGNAAWGTAGNWINDALNLTWDANGSAVNLFISGTTRYLVTQNSTIGIRYQVSPAYGAWSSAVTLDAGTYSAPCVRNQYANDPKSSLDYMYRDGTTAIYFNTLSLIPSTTENFNFMLFF